MRTIAIVVGATLTLAFLIPLVSFQAGAAESYRAENGTQYLEADGILSTDATFLSDIYNDPEALNLLNPVKALDATDSGIDGNYWDSNPGCILWGDVNSATDGNFGTAEVRYSVTDLVGETSEYYRINFKMHVAILKDDPPDGSTAPSVENYVLSFRLGFGYTDEAPTGPNEAIDETYYNKSTSIGSPFQTSASGLIWTGVNNSAEDRPFTRAEMNALYVVIQMRFDPAGWGILQSQSPTPINLGICYVTLQALPTDYTPTPPQTGSFILRPDTDNFAQGWENYSADDYTGMYGALNDTTQHGDAEQSYVNASWSKAAYLGLGFTDPPSWAEDIEYRVVLWAIMRHTETGIGELYSLTMSISSAGLDQKQYFPSTSYTNNTHGSLYIPGSSDYWRLTDLEDIMANFWLDWTGATPSGELRMTQVAFLCVPVIPEDYVPDTDDFTDVAFQEWIIGGGLFTIFALMGAFGLIAGAPLAIIFFKSERTDGVGALAMAVGIIFVSLCFLLAGLSAWA